MKINKRLFLAGGAAGLLNNARLPMALASFASASACGQFEARVFNPKQMEILTALVDVILPETDSPAASAALTHQFIDSAAYDCASLDQQALLKTGLDDLEQVAKTEKAKSFAQLSLADQNDILAARAHADSQLEDDKSFFRLIKDYCLTGYFLSETGATIALAYDKIPGGYQGDLPLAPGQKAWTI